MKKHVYWSPLFVACALLTGCVQLGVGAPNIQDKLKMVSAGYTGCIPEENALTNIEPNLDGSGTWNATCKGKTYLCSTIRTTGESQSYHCAPAAQ
jgi:hypothetical protein